MRVIPALAMLAPMIMAPPLAAQGFPNVCEVTRVCQGGSCVEASTVLSFDPTPTGLVVVQLLDDTDRVELTAMPGPGAPIWAGFLLDDAGAMLVTRLPGNQAVMLMQGPDLPNGGVVTHLDCIGDAAPSQPPARAPLTK
jgi:hypothetical protein